MALSAAAGRSSTLIHRKVISEITRKWMISSSRGVSSRLMSTTNDAPPPPFVWPPKSAPWLSKTSPWLMLPPIFKRDVHDDYDMVYRFYTLGENKLLEKTYDEYDEDEDEDGSEENNEDGKRETKIVSSSRGWLALFENKQMLLANPLSGRYIKLPPRKGLVKHFILSSSNPDDPHLRALIIYGPKNRLAFCHPGHSTAGWTRLGDGDRSYASCAYSPKQNLFLCSWTDDDDQVDHLEAWDLRDPLSPRNIPMPLSDNKSESSSSSVKHKYKFLVVAEASDELFHVTRYVDFVGPHGRHVQDHYYGPKMGFNEGLPYKTLGFDVRKYDPETGSLVRMNRSLGGLALFIGCNDGLALPAADFPELKPDSIYYTGPPEWGGSDDGIVNSGDMGGHDVGIFNYRHNTFSSCYYPPDMQSRKTVCAPMWFTPTPLKRFPLLVENDDGSLSCASSYSFF